MRRARTGFGLAVLIAAILVMRLGTDLAQSREFRLPASDSLRLPLAASSSLAVNDSPASGLHVAQSDCRRWRAAAASLGETYAGHLLRQTVVRRQCRSLEADRVV